MSGLSQFHNGIRNPTRLSVVSNFYNEKSTRSVSNQI